MTLEIYQPVKLLFFSTRIRVRKEFVYKLTSSKITENQTEASGQVRRVIFSNYLIY